MQISFSYSKYTLHDEWTKNPIFQYFLKTMYYPLNIFSFFFFVDLFSPLYDMI